MLYRNATKGPVSIEDYRWKHARKLFDSDAVGDEGTTDTIREVFDQNEYLLDPHTAIGVRAARNCRRDPAVPMITLGTAHPAKFPDAVLRSGVKAEPSLPVHMSDLFEREERYTVLDNDLSAVQDFSHTMIRFDVDHLHKNMVKVYGNLIEGAKLPGDAVRRKRYV